MNRADGPTEPTPPSDNANEESRARLCCPHCNNPITIRQDENDVACPVCGSPFQVDPDRTESWSPDRLPKIASFQLLDVAGRGAFGTVYRAQDEELNRIVAVKVPRSSSPQRDEDKERFLREARNAAQLNHPGIVPVYEVGSIDACPYIVAEFVKGVTLADALTARRFGSREVARLVMQLADALDHAHRQGVVHRDLKPSNIILETTEDASATDSGSGSTARGDASLSTDSASRSGVRSERGHLPRLMDFGLARREGGDVTVTVEGQILGTPAYMSPEQARGEGHRADNRSDLYSLGVVLFELLTGERPFRGNMRMLLQQVLNEEASSPCKLNPSVPRDLETICLKCLEKEPSRRFQSARELADELARFLEGKPILSRPIGRIARLWRWSRRHPTAAALLATPICFLLFLAIGGLGVSINEAAIRRIAEDATEAANLATSQAEKDRFVAEERRAAVQLEAERAGIDAYIVRKSQLQQREQCVERIRQAQRALERLQFRRCNELLTECEPNSGEQDFRSFAWYYLWRQADRLAGFRSLEVEFPDDFRICFSPGGEWLSYTSRHGIHLLDVSMQDVVRIIDCKASDLAFSPDGKRLASVGLDNTIRLWSVETGELIFATDGQLKPIHAIAYSPDGKTIVSAGKELMTKVWNADDGQLVAEISRTDSIARSLAYSDDGKSLAIGLESGSILLYDMPAGKERTSLGDPSTKPIAVEALSFSPDGRVLAAGKGDSSIQLWNVDDGRLVRTDIYHSGPVHAVAFSPDGKQLASSSPGDVINIQEVDTEDITLKIAPGPGGGKSIAYSPDGTRLATGNGSYLSLWDVTDGAVAAISLDGWDDDTTLAYAPGGEALALGGTDGLRLIELAKGTLRTAIPDTGRAAAFSPGGRVIASPSGTRNIGFWDSSTGELRHTLKGHTAEIRSIAFSPDGRTLASCGDDLTIRIWDVRSKQEVRVLREHEKLDCVPIRVMFSSEGRMLVSADRGGNVLVWDVGTGRLVSEFTSSVSDVSDAYLAASPDGQIVAQVSEDSINLWSTADGRLLRSLGITTFRVVTSIPVSVAFTGDGKTLASGHRDGEIHLWDVPTGVHKLALAKHDCAVRSLWFVPDDRTLISVDADGSLHWWRAVLDEDLLVRNPSHSIRCLAYSPDGTTLASGRGDSLVVMWNVAERTPRSLLRGHVGAVRTIAYSPDGHILVSGGADQSLRLWDAAGGQCTATLEGHTGAVNSVAFSPDGKTLASASDDGTVRLWDAANRRILATLSYQEEGALTSVAFLHDGQRVVACGQNSKVMVWDAKTRQIQLVADGYGKPDSFLASFPDDQTIVYRCGEIQARALNVLDGRIPAEWTTIDACSTGAVSPDGKLFAGGRTCLTVVDLSSKSVRHLLPSTGMIHAVTFSPSGREVAYGGAQGRVWIVDAETGEIARRLNILEHDEARQIILAPLDAEALSTDGRTLAATSGRDESSREDVRDLMDKAKHLRANTLAFAPDSKLLASGGADEVVRLWNVESSKLVDRLGEHLSEDHTSPAGTIHSLAFSPDGELLASGISLGRTKVWDVRRREVKYEIDGHGRQTNGLAFSPDGDFLATCGTDYVVRLWDRRKGNLREPLIGHSEPVTSVVFSPDGSLLVSTSSDETAKMWDVAGAEEVATLAGHTEVVAAAAFSPDGSMVATGDWDGKVKLWDAKSCAHKFDVDGNFVAIRDLAFGSSDQHLAIATSKGQLNLWNVESHVLQDTLTMSHLLDIVCVQFSPDDKIIATAGWDGYVKLWEAKTGRHLATLQDW